MSVSGIEVSLCVYVGKLPGVTGDVDWTNGALHMWHSHGVSVREAEEALTDPNAVLFDPDPASNSGRSVRIVGYSVTRQEVLVVILVRREEREGDWWGCECLGGQPHLPADLSRGGRNMTKEAERQLVERIIAESERTKDDPIPEGVKPKKLNKSVPVAVRLSSEEADAVTAMAEEMGVPLSSLLRGWILDGLHGNNAAFPPPVFTAVHRLVADVKNLENVLRHVDVREAAQSYGAIYDRAKRGAIQASSDRKSKAA